MRKSVIFLIFTIIFLIILYLYGFISQIGIILIFSISIIIYGIIFLLFKKGNNYTKSNTKYTFLKLPFKSFIYSTLVCSIIIIFIYFLEQQSCSKIYDQQGCGVGFLISLYFGIIIVLSITFISFLISLYLYYFKKQ